jgi:hypothetical protein
LKVDTAFGLTGEGELHAVGVQAKGEILILPGFMAVECIWTQTRKLQIMGAGIFCRSLWRRFVSVCAGAGKSLCNSHYG